MFRARDATDDAVSAMRLDLQAWRVLKAIILATAICYPIFAVLAIAVRYGAADCYLGLGRDWCMLLVYCRCGWSVVLLHLKGLHAHLVLCSI